MGLITKYFIELPEPGITVSNNVFSGEFILDAEITAEMVSGWFGSAFEVKLFDLPEAKVKELKELQEKKKFFPIKIMLGYFDFPFETVMEGVVDSVKVEPLEPDGKEIKTGRLATTLKGLETATAALRHTDVELSLEADTTIEKAIERLLTEATFARGDVSHPIVFPPAGGKGKLTDKLPATALRGKLGDVLDRLARQAQVEMVVVDKKVHLGQPVRRSDHLAKLHLDENLAVFEPFKESLPDEKPTFDVSGLKAAVVEGFRFVITGDPDLRPGHKVVAAIRDFDELSGGEFLVAGLVHKLTLQAGYSCSGFAAKACSDENCRRRREAMPAFGPDAIARRLTTRVEESQKKRPFVEIGKVKTYTPGSGSGTARHRATLFYGQTAPGNQTQPSIRLPVDEAKDDKGKDKQVFADKPLIAPFAWNRCGLVVPVYPGMKAALVHNQGLQDDTLVAGFLWSEDPSFEPPASRAGDYWLCLPVDFDSAQPPSASTKAVNDLSANNGRRVIEAKGLRIAIGASKLSSAGTRPAEGADDELVIEHASGTKVTIAADGTLTFEAKKVEFKGDLSIEGNVEIK